ncbi:MAG: hypothetical protein FD138_1068 [Planctomycetota bacterium]|nr:MAG: hypothetical protein FD138_1068 [Planctomycetota bacterium]
MSRRAIRMLVIFSLGLMLGSSLLRADELQYPLTAVASADGKSLFIADLNQTGVWKLTDGNR